MRFDREFPNSFTYYLSKEHRFWKVILQTVSSIYRACTIELYKQKSTNGGIFIKWVIHVSGIVLIFLILVDDSATSDSFFAYYFYLMVSTFIYHFVFSFCLYYLVLYGVYRQKKPDSAISTRSESKPRLEKFSFIAIRSWIKAWLLRLVKGGFFGWISRDPYGGPFIHSPEHQGYLKPRNVYNTISDIYRAFKNAFNRGQRIYLEISFAQDDLKEKDILHMLARSMYRKYRKFYRPTGSMNRLFVSVFALFGVYFILGTLYYQKGPYRQLNEYRNKSWVVDYFPSQALLGIEEKPKIYHDMVLLCWQGVKDSVFLPDMSITNQAFLSNKIKRPFNRNLQDTTLRLLIPHKLLEDEKNGFVPKQIITQRSTESLQIPPNTSPQTLDSLQGVQEIRWEKASTYTTGFKKFTRSLDLAVLNMYLYSQNRYSVPQDFNHESTEVRNLFHKHVNTLRLKLELSKKSENLENYTNNLFYDDILQRSDLNFLKTVFH
jgi:hypothetical protein